MSYRSTSLLFKLLALKVMHLIAVDFLPGNHVVAGLNDSAPGLSVAEVRSDAVMVPE